MVRYYLLFTSTLLCLFCCTCISTRNIFRTSLTISNPVKGHSSIPLFVPSLPSRVENNRLVIPTKRSEVCRRQRVIEEELLDRKDVALRSWNDRGGGGSRGGGYRGNGRGGGGGRGGYRGRNDRGGGGGWKSLEADTMKFDTVIDFDDFVPQSLTEKGISSTVTEILSAKGIDTFTPIQQGTYDDVKNGRDMIARSRTGTGKTLAFGLPIIEKLSTTLDEKGTKGRRGRSPSVVILAPTRELAKQVEDQLDVIAKPHGLRVRCIYGGVSYDRQINDINNGIDILVGTPGRIMDHLDRGTLDLSQVQHVVLDEADEMLRMGFAEDIETIFGNFDVSQSQVLLFSATTPSWVQEISKQYLKDPIRVDAVGKGTNRASTTVNHIAVKVPDDYSARKNILEDVIVAHSRGGRVIVFTATKLEADDLSSSSAYAAENTRVLHGDISQRSRELTLKQFREGLFKVLIATDVAARGIDIADVDLVVQYRTPDDADTYVHRSGRTGRAGKKGVCVIMYTDSEGRKISRLEKSIGTKINRVGIPTIEDVVSGITSSSINKVVNVEEKVVPYFMDAAASLIEDLDSLVEGEAKNVDEENSDEENVEEENENMKKTETDLHNKAQTIIARCLAAMTGRKFSLERSLLSGLSGWLTMEMTQDSYMNDRDLRTLVRGLYQPKEGERVNIENIRRSTDGVKILFDLRAEQAEAILKRLEKNDSNEVNMEIATVLPPLENVDPFNRGMRGNGRGRGDDRQGGRGGRRDFQGRGGGDRYDGGGRYGNNNRGGRFDRGDRGDRGRFSNRGEATGNDMGRRGPPSRGRGNNNRKEEQSLENFLESLDWPQ